MIPPVVPPVVRLSITIVSACTERHDRDAAMENASKAGIREYFIIGFFLIKRTESAGKTSNSNALDGRIIWNLRSNVKA